MTDAAEVYELRRRVRTLETELQAALTADRSQVVEWIEGSLSEWITECEADGSGMALWAAQRLRACRTQLQAAQGREKELRKALAQSAADGRWIVGQWQRLRDEPVKSVALFIVKRCEEALAASPSEKSDNLRRCGRCGGPLEMRPEADSPLWPFACPSCDK